MRAAVSGDQNGRTLQAVTTTATCDDQQPELQFRVPRSANLEQAELRLPLPTSALHIMDGYAEGRYATKCKFLVQAISSTYVLCDCYPPL